MTKDHLKPNRYIQIVPYVVSCFWIKLDKKCILPTSSRLLQTPCVKTWGTLLLWLYDKNNSLSASLLLVSPARTSRSPSPSVSALFHFRNSSAAPL